MHVKRLTKKQATLLVGGFAAICMAGGAAWFFMDQQGTPAPRPRPVMAKKASAAKPSGEVTIGTLRKKTAAEEKEKKAPPVAAPVPPVASDTTLGDLTRLRGVKRVLQQEAEIAALRRRVAAAQQPVVATPVPQVQPAPQATIKLPPLDDAEKEKPKKRRSGPSVVSVQGVGERLAANIRGSDGRVITVKNGERFNGGVLVVSRKGVSVRKNGELVRIPFE